MKRLKLISNESHNNVDEGTILFPPTEKEAKEEAANDYTNKTRTNLRRIRKKAHDDEEDDHDESSADCEPRNKRSARRLKRPRGVAVLSESEDDMEQYHTVTCFNCPHCRSRS